MAEGGRQYVITDAVPKQFGPNTSLDVCNYSPGSNPRLSRHLNDSKASKSLNDSPIVHGHPCPTSSFDPNAGPNQLRGTTLSETSKRHHDGSATAANHLCFYPALESGGSASPRKRIIWPSCRAEWIFFPLASRFLPRQAPQLFPRR